MEITLIFLAFSGKRKENHQKNKDFPSLPKSLEKKGKTVEKNKKILERQKSKEIPKDKERKIRVFPSNYRKTGQIRFRKVRFQTPRSVSFLALTKFRGENSVRSSQPIICVPKRTHRVFRRTHRVLPSETAHSKQYSARLLNYFALQNITYIYRYNNSGVTKFRLIA